MHGIKQIVLKLFWYFGMFCGAPQRKAQRVRILAKMIFLTKLADDVKAFILFSLVDGHFLRAKQTNWCFRL
ncbi:hypothetical protein WT77_12580 [Burkholderia stagnalis]|nr:hypothetical protein WT77_12580 [Burkholderia stagnalis]